MIRLVSKQHDGDKTPKEIKTKILDIMFTWTTKYPNETKIKEAYDMLKTQGIVHEPTKNVMFGSTGDASFPPPPRSSDRNAPLDPRHVMLKKLINSKNKDDIQKANLLIQNMCREDERRLQIKGRRLTELRKARENVVLLNEMLDSYQPLSASSDDLQIINEIHDTCELFQPTLLKLINETEEKDEALGEILEVNDKLVAVLEKYRRKVVLGENLPASPPQTGDLLQGILDLDKPAVRSNDSTTGNVMDVLGDIFSKSEPINPGVSPSTSTAGSDLLIPNKEVTAPMNRKSVESPVTKYDALMNLSRLQSTNSSSSVVASVPPPPAPQKRLGLDLDSLVDGMKTKLLPQSTPPEEVVKKLDDANGDDDEAMLTSVVSTPTNKQAPATTIDLSDDHMILNTNTSSIIKNEVDTNSATVSPASNNAKKDFKSLAEIHIDLDSIQPSTEPPLTILDEDKGLKIMLNFAKDRPRDDVLVAVISTINYGSQPVNNFQFEASVSKPCKLRLLPASATELPAAKPFRPPADSIFQILLLANSTQQTIPKITCIFSYCLGDDPDPIKESVEVKDLPYRVD